MKLIFILFLSILGICYSQPPPPQQQQQQQYMMYIDQLNRNRVANANIFPPGYQPAFPSFPPSPQQSLPQAPPLIPLLPPLPSVAQPTAGAAGPQNQRVPYQFKQMFNKKYSSSMNPDPMPSNFDNKCGLYKPQIVNKISNGVQSEDDQFPWQVQLIIESADRPDSHIYCGGTLISDTCILTAAHCFDELTESQRASHTQIHFNSVMLDDDDFKGRQRNREYNMYNRRHQEARPNENSLITHAIKAIVHRDYVPAMSEADALDLNVMPGPFMDFAVLKFDVDERYRKKLMPVCLPADGYEFNTGTLCKVMGHGFMSPEGEVMFEMPSRLQVADVRVSKNQKCREKIESYSIRSKLTADTMCIRGSPFPHPCIGDSGGPMVCLGKNPHEIHGSESTSDESEEDYPLESDGSKPFKRVRGKYVVDIEEEEERRYFLAGVTSFAVSGDEDDRCGYFKTAVFGKTSHVKQWLRDCKCIAN